METTTMAIYRNGVLKLKRRLPFRNDELLLVRVVRKSDPVRDTQGIIQVSKSFARELLKPHRTSIVDR